MATRLDAWPGWSIREPTVAERPVLTLARLLTGVVLTRGRLGHQVLGEMLLMGANEVAVAGAAVVVAATSRQRSAVVQGALRTVVPALAVRGLLRKQERRIDWKETRHAERERSLEERERELESRPTAPAAGGRGAEREARTPVERALARMVALEEENRRLQAEREGLLIRLRALDASTRPPAGGS